MQMQICLLIKRKIENWHIYGLALHSLLWFFETLCRVMAWLPFQKREKNGEKMWAWDLPQTQNRPKTAISSLSVKLAGRFLLLLESLTPFFLDERSEKV